MKQLFAIAVNGLKVEFADRSTWLSFVILPVLFTAVIGLATGGAGDPDADARIPVALVDHDGGALARDFAAALAASTVVRAETMDEAAALTAFGAMEDSASAIPSGGQEVAAVVMLPAGFTGALLAGGNAEVALQSVGDNRAPAVAEEVRAAAVRVSGNLLAAQMSVEEAQAMRPFASAAEQEAYFRDALEMAGKTSASPPVAVAATQASEVNEQLVASGFALSSPAQLVTWVL
ncbi:MAG: hypothetical protein HY784_06795, partial [Chloroflexi bacterium]|nr:hypothetical protein [Chloroflexota bacterium]